MQVLQQKSKGVREKFYRFIMWNWFPFVVLTLILAVVHLAISPIPMRDDIYFIETSQIMGFGPYLADRYVTWTSRLLIEFVMISLLLFELVLWKFLNVGMIVLGLYAISKMFIKENIYLCNWVLCMAFLLYPYHEQNSAGWVATTLNYVWPTTCALIALIPIKKTYYDEKFHWYEWLVYLPAVLFASNQEQAVAALLGIYATFILFFFVQKKKPVVLGILFLISLASIIFILTCSGNEVRNIQEIGNWFPEFDGISLFSKLDIGISSTLYYFIMSPSYLFLIFSLILSVAHIRKNSNLFTKLVATIPLAVNVAIGFFPSMHPVLEKISTSLEHEGIITIPVTINDIGLALLLGIVCFAMVYSIFFLCDNKRKSILVLFILGVGFGTRVIMSFSPTIWVSLERTFYCMDIAVMIAILLMIQERMKYKEETIFYMTSLGFGSFMVLQQVFPLLNPVLN